MIRFKVLIHARGSFSVPCVLVCKKKKKISRANFTVAEKNAGVLVFSWKDEDSLGGLSRIVTKNKNSACRGFIPSLYPSEVEKGACAGACSIF